MEGPAQEAFFSGYYTDYKYFQKLVLALRPDCVDWLAKTNFVICVDAYKEWRTELPKDEQDKVMTVKIILEFPDANTPNMGADKDNKFLFPTRYIPAPDGSLIEQFPEAMHETEADKDRLDELIAFVKRHNFVVDRDRLHWGCFKDTHPFWDDTVSDSE